MSDGKLTVTVLVDGKPRSETFPANEKVEEVIKSLLPPGMKQDWNQWQLAGRAGALDPARSLEEDGVVDGDQLALTKKEGGGG